MAIKKIGVSTSRHIAKKTIARCIPIVGAVGVGAYAYYDTSRVGKTAIELFSSNIEQNRMEWNGMEWNGME